MVPSMNKRGDFTSNLYKSYFANSLLGYNEQLRSIQQVLARRVVGSQPSSSQQQDPHAFTTSAEQQQQTSKPAITGKGSTVEDATDVKFSNEEAIDDDFSRGVNCLPSGDALFTPNLAGATVRLMASSNQQDDNRYADADDAEMGQDDEGEGDFIFPEDRSLRLQSSTHSPPVQIQPTLPKRSRPSSSSNGDAPRPLKQIRSPEPESSKTNISSLSQQYSANGDGICQDGVLERSYLYFPNTSLTDMEALILQKTKENLNLRAQLSVANPQATLEAARLRSQLANLASEARARGLVVQEYLSNWQRSQDEASLLQSKLAEERTKVKDLSKMVEAMRKKGERDSKELERVKAEHGSMVEAARRLFSIEAMRAMASEEFGEAGEALDELFAVVAKQKKKKGH